LEGPQCIRVEAVARRDEDARVETLVKQNVKAFADPYALDFHINAGKF
jgi:hypothetical protein